MAVSEAVKGAGTAERIRSRDTNLELYRIIGMFLIVMHHYVVNSGLTDPEGVMFSSPLALRSVSLFLLGAWGKAGINCFLMITGYFMCKSKISAKKYAKLMGEVLFYGITVFCVFLCTKYVKFSFREFVITVFPFSEISDNFTGCYLVFFLFIPFINCFINSINEKQHFYLLLLCGFTYILIGTVHRTTLNYVSWFIVVYLIASYIRFYPKKIYANVKLWTALTVLSAALMCISIIAGSWFLAKTGLNYIYYFVSDSNSLLPVVFGVSSFMLFKHMNIQYSKVINTIAASTFGVLCIHANSEAMRRWLWHDTLNNVGHYNPLHAVISVIGVYIICTLIDMFRIRLIEKPFFALWDKKYPAVAARYKQLEEKTFSRLNIKQN